MANNSTQSFIDLYTTHALTFLTISDLYTYEALILLLYGVIIIFSFFTNAIAILVFSFGRRSRSDLSPFLLNLSVFNIIMTVYCIPFTITSVIFQRWLYLRELCIVLDVFKIFSVAGVLLTMIAIAIDRYCAVRYPLTLKIYSGFKRNVIILVIIWMLSIGVAILRSPARSIPMQQKRLWVHSRTLLAVYIDALNNDANVSESDALLNNLRYRVVDTIQCVPNKSEPPVEVQRTILNFLQTYFVPLFILAFVYLRIAATLWQRSNRKRSEVNGTTTTITLQMHESTQFKRKLKQGIKMLIVVLVLYALLWLPMNVFQLCVNLICDRGSSYPRFCRNGTLLKLLYIASHLLTVSNTAINPIIYGFANSRFRSDIQQFKHRLCHWHRRNASCSGTHTTRAPSYEVKDRLHNAEMNANLLSTQQEANRRRSSPGLKAHRVTHTRLTLLKESPQILRHST